MRTRERHLFFLQKTIELSNWLDKISFPYKVINNCHVFFGIVISVVAEIQRLWFVLPRLWYCTMKWSKCSKLQIVLLNNRLTRFIYLWKSWTFEVFTLQKKQRKLFAFCRESCSLSQATFYLHDNLLLPQSELVSRLQNDVTKRRQTPQTSFRLTLINNFVRLLEACGNFVASCGEDFWLLSFQSSCR